MEQGAARIPDAVEKQKLLAKAERVRIVAKITGKYSNIINMVATPLFTFFFWLFYKRGKYNYTEHLVANMYFIGFIMLFYALFFFPLRSILPASVSFAALGSFLFLKLYIGDIAYYQFMEKKGAVPMTKAYLTSLLLSVLWASLTITLISYSI